MTHNPTRKSRSTDYISTLLRALLLAPLLFLALICFIAWQPARFATALSSTGIAVDPDRKVAWTYYDCWGLQALDTDAPNSGFFLTSNQILKSPNPPPLYTHRVFPSWAVLPSPRATSVRNYALGWRFPCLHSTTLYADRMLLAIARLDFAQAQPIPLGVLADLLFSAGVSWPILLALHRLRRAVRKRRGLCPRCAYNLSTLPAHICPECGPTP